MLYQLVFESLLEATDKQQQLTCVDIIFFKITDLTYNNSSHRHNFVLQILRKYKETGKIDMFCVFDRVKSLVLSIRSCPSKGIDPFHNSFLIQ